MKLFPRNNDVFRIKVVSLLVWGAGLCFFLICCPLLWTRSCRASQQSRSNYRFFPAIRNLNQFGPMDFEK